MQKRITQLGWQAALALLAWLLAGCGTVQGAALPTAATLGAPASATSAPATAPLILPTSTQLPAAASPTAIPTLALLTDTAPAASAQPVGLTATATPDPAVAAVLAYLEARARTDLAAATNLSCRTWKPKAVTEVVSFRSMNAKLVGVTCQVKGSAGAYTLVGCGGKMVTTYGGESRDWDLSTFVYQMTAEDGQWKMCGYH